ncbi:MAG: MltA domain-containing protein [Bacteriovoracaceae bacterium]
MSLSLGVAAQEVTPTSRVYQSIEFEDDLDFENLALAVDRQLASYDVQGLKGTIKFGTVNYPKTILRSSLELLKDLAAKAQACTQRRDLDDCQADFSRAMNDKFLIYRPVPKKSEMGSREGRNTTHYTSYYSPDLHGSRVKTDRFKHAIYKTPTNSADLSLSRVDIDYHGALDGKGLELFYVEDSFFDLYLLQVQGGGRIHVMNADGTEEIKYLSYDGKNDRAFNMIYKYMVSKGYLRGDASVPAQRRFLEENPDKEEEIFTSSPSYVFFKETNEEPVGLDNIPLTERRSLALDSRIYKTTGLINFVKAVKPTSIDENGRVVKAPFSRFFISQDTGGAIRGNARCDLYAGYGPMAELAAYNTNDMGEQYFLIQKTTR